MEKVNVGRLVTALAPRESAWGPETVSPLKDLPRWKKHQYCDDDDHAGLPWPGKHEVPRLK